MRQGRMLAVDLSVELLERCKASMIVEAGPGRGVKRRYHIED